MNYKRCILYIVCLFSFLPILHAAEVAWTPAYPYNYDRRHASSENDPSPWSSLPKAGRLEYRLELLMQAQRNTTELWKSAKLSGAYAKLSESDKILSAEILSDLDETLELTYFDAIPYFKIKANSTLLLMMLYHYNKYVNSALENWPRVIKELQKIDPVITENAAKLARDKNMK